MPDPRVVPLHPATARLTTTLIEHMRTCPACRARLAARIRDRLKSTELHPTSTEPARPALPAGEADQWRAYLRRSTVDGAVKAFERSATIAAAAALARHGEGNTMLVGPNFEEWWIDQTPADEGLNTVRVMAAKSDGRWATLRVTVEVVDGIV
jgi:hypothetical protein